MSSDATTLRLRDAPPLVERASPRPTQGGTRERADASEAARRRRGRLVVGALLLMVACGVLFVLIAANRPSMFAATTRYGFFPGWMAGPLGGLLGGMTRNPTALRWTFTGMLLAMYLAYALVLAHAPSLGPTRLRARWVIGAILALHAIFLLSPPLALTDVFNYINYGRMEVVDHLNPYTTYPILEPHSDPSYALSNWHQLLSPYGPLFTLLTFALVPLGIAASFWAIKAILIAASLGTLLLVWRCACLLELDPVRAVALVGLNPIVIVWGLGGDHNDFLTVFAIVLGFYLLLSVRARERGAVPGGGVEAAGVSEGAVPGGGVESAGVSAGAVLGGGVEGAGIGEGAVPGAGTEATRGEEEAAVPGGAVAAAGEPPGGGSLGEGPDAAHANLIAALAIGAGVAFVAATALKASAGLLIPIVLVSLLRGPRRRLLQVLAGMALAGLILGAASLAAFGLHIPDLSTQSRLVTPISIPNLIGLALGAGGETETLHTLLTAVLALSLLGACAMAWRRRSPIAASGWATVALLVTLGWVLPWYILWLLPLAALSGSRRLRNASLALGVYLIVAWAPASGLVWSGIGFHPQKTPLGRLHQRYVKELLN